MMSFYHILFILFFCLAFILSYYTKGWKKVCIIALELVAAGLCIVDYGVTLYRGIGFVKTDFVSLRSVADILCRLDKFTGKKFYICLVWLLASLVCSIGRKKWESLHICKGSNRQSFVIRNSLAVGIVCVGIGIGIITEYPNEYELFRGDKTFPKTEQSDKWYESNREICHALGETAEFDTLTSSYQALSYNYARGFRVFETDISFTSDGIPVLRHDWASDLGQADDFGWSDEVIRIPTAEEFKNAKIYDKYEPMTLLDIFRFMEMHKDMYLVFDTKITAELSEKEQHEIIVKLARENGLEDVLSRVVIQLYYYGMYEEVNQVYSFENYLLTMYVIGEAPGEEIAEFLNERRIPVLTVPDYYDSKICDTMHAHGIKVFVHTINDLEDRNRRVRSGFDGIYTDRIYPALSGQ